MLPTLALLFAEPFAFADFIWLSGPFQDRSHDTAWPWQHAVGTEDAGRQPGRAGARLGAGSGEGGDRINLALLVKL